MIKPACRSTADSRILDLSWIVELSCTAICCWVVLEGRPSRNSGVRTGAGPFGLKVALLCLQQYGAASAAPMRPDEANRRRLSNVLSSKKVQAVNKVNRFHPIASKFLDCDAHWH